MALFKTTAEVKLYINIDANTSFEKLNPVIETAEREFIKPLLGKEYYDEFLAAYIAGSLSAAQTALLPYIQKALANYAGFFATGTLGLKFGDLGFQQQSNQNSSPAPAWMVKELKLEYLTTGDKCADLLLEFLELAAIIPYGGVEDDRLYKKWYDSEANTKLSGSIVYKTSIASKYIDINNSRRLFLRLKKRITEIEQSVIKRIICKEQYDELITAIKANNISPEQAALIEKMEPIIAKRALYVTLPMLPVMITADGLFLQTSNDGVIQKQLAGATEKRALMDALKDGDVGYETDEAELHDFILANIADYPLISGSTCWSASKADSDERWKIDNYTDNKHFSI